MPTPLNQPGSSYGSISFEEIAPSAVRVSGRVHNLPPGQYFLTVGDISQGCSAGQQWRPGNPVFGASEQQIGPLIYNPGSGAAEIDTMNPQMNFQSIFQRPVFVSTQIPSSAGLGFGPMYPVQGGFGAGGYHIVLCGIVQM